MEKNNKKKKEDNGYKKLKIIISIVPRGKKEIFIDLVEKYESNISMNFFGKGIASEKVINSLGLDSNNKDVICSLIREDKVKDCLLELEDKIKALKHSDGIAFSIPLESIIGNRNYLFFANLGRSDLNGK